jgi:hypothetical protein
MVATPKQEEEEQMIESLDKELSAIAVKEASVEQQLVALHEQYPDVFKKIEAIESAQQEVARLKDAVKARLIADQDFDLHTVGDLSVSVSAVAKVKVVDIDKVPGEFKDEMVVANEKKAQEYLKVMGKLPDGFSDASYYRLNWKIKKGDK